MLSYKNILVPTDFSENSIHALEFAHYLARQNKSSLHVLHIIESINRSKPFNDNFSELRFERSRFLEAEEELRRFVNKISLHGVQIIEALDPGKPHEQILNYSRHHNIDLIVIASHGWTGLTNMVTGSVARKILSSSEIPTILVKSNALVMEKGIQNRKSTFAENWVG
jgi:nucleotide-binding universal stress UspA family protein